jgi:hypothetical protein
MLRHIPPSSAHFVLNSNKARLIGLFGDRGFAVFNSGLGWRSGPFCQAIAL